MSECLADLLRNQWPIWIGMGGRFGTESVAGLVRNLQCVASSVEMVLKLEGLLAPDSFCIQDKYADTLISGKEIVELFENGPFPPGDKRIKFKQLFFDILDDCFSSIRRELSQNRFVIVPIITGNRICHAHVICDFNCGQYRTITKLFGSDKLINVPDMESRFNENFNQEKNKPTDQRFATDILVYEKVSPFA